MARRKKIPAAPRPHAYRHRHDAVAAHQETPKKEDAHMLEYDPRPQLPFTGCGDDVVLRESASYGRIGFLDALGNAVALFIPVALILGIAFLLLRHFSGYFVAG